MLHITIPILTFTLSVVLSKVQGVQLPKLRGPLDIGTITFELTDHSRLDPFSPTPQNRSLQLSLYYPISNGSNLPFSTYLPPRTAQNIESVFAIPAGALQNISTRAHINASIRDGGRDTSTVLFSPGSGASRLLYATFVQNLASEGYVVVSIDHPFDASIVELSDGRVITANIPSTPEAIDLALAVRVADARFVLDELRSGRNFRVPGLHQSLDTSRVGFFGHSLGGATTATTMVLDGRVACGVNMDGPLPGPDIQRGFSKPFMTMEAEGHNKTTDPTWAEVFPKITGFQRQIETKGSLHFTYTDGPVLSNILQLNLPAEIYGTIAGERVNAIQHAYLTAFFDFALRHKKETLLDGPSKQFPEVTFVL